MGAKLDDIIRKYRIAHISDIHFGFGLFGRTTSFKQKIGNALERDLKKTKPDILIVTGDVTVSATYYQFAKAYDYFKSLLKSLNLDWSKSLIIPGNHDDNCRAIGLKFRPGYKVTKFNTFFKSKTNTPSRLIGPNGIDVYQIIPEYRPEIIIFGISSLESGTIARGSVAIESLNWVEDTLEKFIKRGLKPVVVIAIHHHPTGVENLAHEVSECTLVNSPQFMARLKDIQIPNVIVLHGHQHAYWQQHIYKIPKNNTGKIAIVSSGCATGRPIPETLSNQYSIIELMMFNNGNWKLNVESRIFNQTKEVFRVIESDALAF